MFATTAEWAAAFVQNPWVQLSSFLIGIAGLAATFLTVDRKRKLLTFAVERRLIFDDISRLHPKLAITFGGAALPNLALTTIAIWNEGKQTIRRADVAEREPVIVQFPVDDVIMVHWELTDQTKACGFAITEIPETPNSLRVDFDFIDRRQGCQLVVLHTGGGPVAVSGTIVGAGRIKHVEDLSPWPRRFRLLTFVMFLAPLATLPFFDKSTSEWLAIPFVLLTMFFYTLASFGGSHRWRHTKLFKGRFDDLGEWRRDRHTDYF